MWIWKIFFLIIVSVSSYAQALQVNHTRSFIPLLPYSQIYIDKTKKLTINDILKHKVTFKDNSKELLGYGFSPKFDVWIKFTLTNNHPYMIHKVLEYNNPITTYLKFYDPYKKYKVQEDGLFTMNKKRKSINPIFSITLNPYESKTYYLKASSYITTLIVNLKLWNLQNFYQKELEHQSILALFFGAMIILALYNLFIFFFTKDISYFFYFLYIFGVVIHHAIYRGIGNTYLLNQEWIIHSIRYASVISSLPILFLCFFTKTFLHVKQYPIINKILNICMIFFPLSVVLFISTDDFNKFRNIPNVMLLAYLLLITIYAAWKKNRQAYFILIGWCAIFLAIFFMLLSSAGIFDIYHYFPYFIETSLVFEAMIFSIALADRIKQLQKDKDDANELLIIQKENERQRLSSQVEEKTYYLKEALSEKELLLKELNHRVKNNMQMIVSLIRLQRDGIKDEKLKELLTTIQNRINTMRHLHELLYKQNQIKYINTQAYFNLLIEEIEESYYNENVSIEINIDTELQLDQAIYCGIILNELITNSFKYAFKDNKLGQIVIRLTKKEDTYSLFVSDNGIGYDTEKQTESLGLILVNTLAKAQLKGTIHIDTKSGVKVHIEWHEDAY
jgi:two-component system, sensor histidine kinase LadS